MYNFDYIKIYNLREGRAYSLSILSSSPVIFYYYVPYSKYYLHYLKYIWIMKTLNNNKNLLISIRKNNIVPYKFLILHLYPRGANHYCQPITALGFLCFIFTTV